MSARHTTADGLRASARGPAARPGDLLIGAVGRFALCALTSLIVITMVPLLWGWRPVVIESGSMAPAVQAGDVVVVAPSDGEGLGPGTVITFRTEASRLPVTHRIVGVNDDGAYRTRGDANEGVDSTPVAPGQVLGVARLLVPYVGLPAYWARNGAWVMLAAFAAVVGTSGWLSARGRTYPAGEGPIRRWAGSVGLVLLVAGAAATGALAAFSGSTASPANSLAAGTWAGTAVVDVAAGEEHSCAALADGSAWCWGENRKGQLGDGTTTDRTAATRVAGAGGTGFLEGVVGITAGREHTCARLADGSAYCWGENSNGQLGDGGKRDADVPVRVAGIWGWGSLSGVTSMDAGRDHTCALLDDATLACWGDNRKGQLGDGSWSDRSEPVRVAAASGWGSLGSVAQFNTGQQHTCAALADGTAWCWGEGGRHRLGNGSTSDRNLPTQVRGPGGSGTASGVAWVTAGDQHSCAVHTSGSVWCWGRNDQGQLGIGEGTAGIERYPVRVVGVGGSGLLGGVAAVGAGQDHTCALHDDGAVTCWGQNTYGQVGDGSTVQRWSPEWVAGPGGTGVLEGAFDLSVDWNHACAALPGGEVWCWGRNDHGQLGDGTQTHRSEPVQVTGL